MNKRSGKVDALLAIAGGCAALVGVGGSVLGCPVSAKYGGPPIPPPDTNTPPPEEAKPPTPSPPQPTEPAVKYGGPPVSPSPNAPAVKYGGPSTR